MVPKSPLGWLCHMTWAIWLPQACQMVIVMFLWHLNRLQHAPPVAAESTPMPPFLFLFRLKFYICYSFLGRPDQIGPCFEQGAYPITSRHPFQSIMWIHEDPMLQTAKSLVKLCPLCVSHAVHTTTSTHLGQNRAVCWACVYAAISCAAWCCLKTRVDLHRISQLASKTLWILQGRN